MTRVALIKVDVATVVYTDKDIVLVEFVVERQVEGDVYLLPERLIVADVRDRQENASALLWGRASNFL